MDRRDASVISRLPLRPNKAGTKVNISFISWYKFQYFICGQKIILQFLNKKIKLKIPQCAYTYLILSKRLKIMREREH